jgi:hypothetical protein
VTGYADPEKLIADWLCELLEIKTWIDPIPQANWWGQAPIAHVQRGRGLGAVPLSLDDVTLDIDTYAANADHARKTASDIWAAMTLQLPLVTLPGGLLVKLSQAITPPLWAPDPKVFRRTAAYRVILHGFVT